MDEVLQMAHQSMQGVIWGNWPSFGEGSGGAKIATTKQQVLAQWDRVTETMNAHWPQIPPLASRKSTRLLVCMKALSTRFFST